MTIAQTWRPPAAAITGSPGKAVRGARLLAARGRSVFVPLDHTVTIGPIAGGTPTSTLVGALAEAGVDAVIVHKGRVRTIDPALFASLGLVVHVSAGTNRHADRDSKVIVGAVEDAVRYGADAVSVHVNVGSANEPEQLRDLAVVAQECDALGMPLLAMMYARPVDGDEDVSVGALSHLTAIAVDLGADLVKISYPGDPAGLAQVVASSAIPIFVAGGGIAPTAEANRELAQSVFAAGAAGLSFGRSVFESTDPLQIARILVGCADEAACRFPIEDFAAPAVPSPNLRRVTV